MKRIVTLLLAALLCLPTISARAASASERFTDWELVHQKSAVTMMFDLGLIAGYENGSFQPYRGVTRAEAVKMIAGLLTAEPIQGRECRYPDADAHWAGKFVEFCAERGIISGGAGSNFRPQDGVTYRELAKMLLAALGHRTDGYVGKNWAEAVDRDAVELGIYESIEVDKGRRASRESACRVISNALQCSVIEGYDAEGRPQYQLDEMLQPKSLLQVRFAVIPVTGWVQANAVADLRENSPGLMRNGIHLSGYNKDFFVSSEMAEDESMLGHQMTLYTRFDRDYNQVVGVPGVNPSEISHTLRGQRTLQAIMDIQRMKMDEKTMYYRDYEPATQEIVQNLTDEEEIVIIDHNGDKIVDLVMVKSESSDE